MVGNGELRPAMESFIKDKGLKDVYLPGFINQSEIVKYYALADVFVLCSETGETWGLSINEALNFSLPVVVSETAGCSDDLVQIGKNGLVFETGNIESLAEAIQKALQLVKVDNDPLMKFYSFRTIGESLVTLRA